MKKLFKLYKYNDKDIEDYKETSHDEMVKLYNKSLKERKSLWDKLMAGSGFTTFMWAVGAFMTYIRLKPRGCNLIAFSEEVNEKIGLSQSYIDAMWFVFVVVTIMALICIIYCCYIYVTEYKGYSKDVLFYGNLLIEK